MIKNSFHFAFLCSIGYFIFCFLDWGGKHLLFSETRSSFLTRRQWVPKKCSKAKSLVFHGCWDNQANNACNSLTLHSTLCQQALHPYSSFNPRESWSPSKDLKLLTFKDCFFIWCVPYFFTNNNMVTFQTRIALINTSDEDKTFWGWGNVTQLFKKSFKFLRAIMKQHNLKQILWKNETAGKRGSCLFQSYINSCADSKTIPKTAEKR